MPITPRDLMSGSVVQHEGRIVKVKSVSPDFVTLEDRKEWIGGSFISPVLLSDRWLEALGFKQDEKEDNIWSHSGIIITYHGVGIFQVETLTRTYTSVHELQLLFLVFCGGHLPIPKFKKK